GRDQPRDGRAGNEADRGLDGPGDRVARRQDLRRRAGRGPGSDRRVPGAGHLGLAAAGRSSGEDHYGQSTNEIQDGPGGGGGRRRGLAFDGGARRGDRAARQDEDERQGHPLLRRRLHDRGGRPDDEAAQGEDQIDLV